MCVGILSALRATQTPAEVEAAITAPTDLPIASPLSPNDHLADVLWADIFGVTERPVDRRAAMRIPAVARGRNLIVSTICQMPLRAYAKDAELDPQPTWLYATDADSPLHRIAWTIDDLIYYGVSCWWRDNNADGSIKRVHRLEQADWHLDDDGHVLVNGTIARPDQVIVIPGLHEGILAFGRDTIRDAAQLYSTVRQRINSPIPMIELHQVDGEQLDRNAIKELVSEWVVARRNPDGAVGFTNKSVELRVHKSDDSQLMIEARNAAALDLARLIGVHAGMLDATAPKASLNYETTSGRNQEFVDIDLGLYMAPIAARLSMDDVVPRGQRVAFDRSDFTTPTPSPSGPATED